MTEKLQEIQDANIVSELEMPAEQMSHGVKKNVDGIVLIPSPSDDPRDPLNWPMRRKSQILAVVSLAVFAGFSAPLAGQLQIVPQSKLYKVTINQMAYATSSASAGMAAAGFFFFPLSHVIGRSSAIFWSLIGTLLSQIWAALMTREDQYNSFVVSRFFAGFFGSVTASLGPRVLVDLFFLHQRGRAYTIFHWCFDFGTVASPTISALITANSSWTNTYKWTAGLLGFTIILFFIFMHETWWNRNPGAKNPEPPKSFLANRIATFFPGTRVTPRTSFSQFLKITKTPFLIALSPVTLTLSVFTLVSFGFYIAMNSLLPVWLQKPVKAGGYGFTSKQTAEFSFVHWISMIITLIYGQFLSDRLPLYICTRFNDGVWKPEYRLHALWIPGLIFNPIGLGLFGACLQYHLSWGLLALANGLVTFGSLTIMPITVNYLNECFIKNPAEASVALNAYRVGFGLSVAFYIKKWAASVTVGWAYGMMAFFVIFSFLFVVLLMWKGHQIREWTLAGLSATEEGKHVIEEESVDGGSREGV